MTFAQKDIIRLINKIKRQQRKDSQSEIIQDKLFNSDQGADIVDKYFDWLIVLVKEGEKA